MAGGVRGAVAYVGVAAATSDTPSVGRTEGAVSAAAAATTATAVAPHASEAAAVVVEINVVVML